MTTDEDVRNEIIDTVRRFVAREVIPVASALEHEDRFPRDIVAQMRDLGLFGVTIPEAYGGLGLDLLTYIGVIEELAYGWMSLTGVVNTHTMAATLIMDHGSDEQKQRWLPIMASGERRGALSLSEPDAGSDTRNISCRAHTRRRRVRHQRHQGLGHQRRDGLGSSPWRPAPTRASPPSSSRRSRGRDSRASRSASDVGKLGYKGVETVEMAYADHRIPAANLIGEAGRGLPQILSVLELGRINIAARAVGVARAAFDAALAYAQERVTIRQAHRRAPGHPAQAGRHGHPAGGGSPAHPQRRRTQDGRAALRRRGGHGQALRQRDRARAGDRGHADPRRRRATPPISRSSATTGMPP